MTTILKKDSTVVTNVMEFTVQKDNFLKAITSVLGAISGRTTIPILGNILIQNNGPDRLILTATDLELGIRTECQAVVGLQGAVTIPAKKLYEIIRELPTGEIEVIVGKNSAVNIKTNKSFFKIMGLEPDDFPKPPEPTPEQTFELEQETLRDCLQLTAFAVSKDEARYALNGVLLMVRNSKARFVATDGKRLAYIEHATNLDKNTLLEAIIPNKTIIELMKALAEGVGVVKIVWAQNQTIIQINKTTLISRLIEGRFPNYEQVVPKEEKTTAEINRQELLSAMRRASILTSQENQLVKLDFMQGKLLISSRAANLGEAKEEIQAEVRGDDLSIGFNPTYIIDALKNLETEKVTLSMTEPDKPGLLKAQDNYLYVVMPMQLS
ncbi:MAG: DNA polymerase III subunit beta [Candidatus Omnitrophica bacterium]|nr:DNA polymerase III subunit beta [Candidatus Omnitrophota bacterium]